MFELHGKKALVTGSTQGIGYAVAKALVNAGAEVIVHCSNDLQKAKRIQKEIGAASAVTADLSVSDEARGLHEKTGDVDLLILNASSQIAMKWYEIDEASFDRQINVNLKSSLILMQSYYKKMKENGFGRIVAIGSVQQYKPHKNMAVYAASKNALLNLVKNVASQVAAEGITVNSVSPGAISTPRNALALEDEEYRRQVISKIPCGRLGLADDIAGAVLLLCSDGGSYITGEDISVDGGMKL